MGETEANHRAVGYAPGGPWTPALDARLIAMWYDGLPTAEIGDRLGITKNAVIGRKNRLGLASRLSPIKGGPVVKPKRKPAPIALPFSARIASQPARSEYAPGVLFDDAVKTGREARTGSGGQHFVTDFKRHPLPIPRGSIGPARTCQWTDCHRAPWLMCDAPTTAGYSWCAAHKAIVFKDAA
jgi:hypothetical protein